MTCCPTCGQEIPSGMVLRNPTEAELERMAAEWDGEAPEQIEGQEALFE